MRVGIVHIAIVLRLLVLKWRILVHTPRHAIDCELVDPVGKFLVKQPSPVKLVYVSLVSVRVS